MFASLCAYCGCQELTQDFPNSSYEVKDNFEGINLTGKDILQYIAECAGGFVVANQNGYIQIRNYQNNPLVLGNNRYVSNISAIYNTPIITSVVAKATEEDAGVISEEGITVYDNSNGIVVMDGSYISDSTFNVFGASIDSHTLDADTED